MSRAPKGCHEAARPAGVGFCASPPTQHYPLAFIFMNKIKYLLSSISGSLFVLFFLAVIVIPAPSVTSAQELPVCTASDWSCADWGACHADGNYFQDRTCSKITSCEGGVTSPSTQQLCTPPFCTSYTYSDWSSCDPVSGTQERTNISNSPSDCIIDFSGSFPAPITRQRCTPECATSSWSCGAWGSCSSSSSQTRTCTGALNCQGGVPSPSTTQACTYTPPTCTSFTYSNWSSCSSSGSQARSVITSYPSSCAGGGPVVSQSCTYCSLDKYECGEWGTCYSIGRQSRTCNKISVCPTASIHGPQTYSVAQNCTPSPQPKVETIVTPPPVYQPPQPSCTADTWTCGTWGICSPSGIQSRNCNKTFNCPSVETAPPSISQYCTPPNLGKYQVSPADQQVANQNNIIKATVNLWCLQTNEKFYSVGSGTIIDSNGTILTNKHVVADTVGCRVGFVENYKDDPYFGDKHIADIIKTSTNADIAVLKLRNPSKKILTYVDITSGSSNALGLEDKIITYGYPTAFGTKITSTRGDFSGVEGDFLKTTAIIDKGNSGGGAYLQDGTFIGMPTKIFQGTFNNLGGILSVNTIKNWLSGASLAYNDESANEYSRVSSVLENIDLKKLDTLKLFISDTDSKGNNITPVIAPTTSQKISEATEQPQASKPQRGSTILIASTSKDTTQPAITPSPAKKGLWSWFKGLFGF